MAPSPLLDITESSDLFLALDDGVDYSPWSGEYGDGSDLPQCLPYPSQNGVISFLINFISRLLLITTASLSPPSSSLASCDDPTKGYQCSPKISHHWGQYSAYYEVPSSIDSSVPEQCNITFVQVLSRHGARDPTEHKTGKYYSTIAKIKSNVHKSAFKGEYKFLKNFDYTLGADQMTKFGRQQMLHSGGAFFERYTDLTSQETPFIRASGQKRVVDSAKAFALGYHSAKVAAKRKDKDADYPYYILTIPESSGVNNTLAHDLCDRFERESDDISQHAQSVFLDTWLPAVRERLNKDLPNADLSHDDTITMMDLCPFTTVADPKGRISPFCDLFSNKEWLLYDYYQTIGKYYSNGAGNSLGPTQGIGWASELLARLTSTPVHDHTSTNHTLDSDPDTFPLGRLLYADFSHDNDMSSMFFALGLYNSTPELSLEARMSTAETKGYAVAWTVPFASRAYFEKMQCEEEEEELVRVIVNGRVVPLDSLCGGDKLGRCKLTDFVSAMTFVRGGGNWEQCFES